MCYNLGVKIYLPTNNFSSFKIVARVLIIFATIFYYVSGLISLLILVIGKTRSTGTYFGLSRPKVYENEV